MQAKLEDEKVPRADGILEGVVVAEHDHQRVRVLRERLRELALQVFQADGAVATVPLAERGRWQHRQIVQGLTEEHAARLADHGDHRPSR